MKNKTVKRVLAVLLSAAMIAAMTGCAGAETKSEESSSEEATEEKNEAGETEDGESFDSLLEQLSFDAETLPNGYKSVVYVSGSWYDMGYQYASQVPEVVKRDAADGLGSMGAAYDLDGLLEASQEYKDYYSEHAPELLELYKGMADAIGVDQDVFIAAMVNYAAVEEQTEEDVERDEEGCSSVAAWGEATKDGQLIVGADWDSIGANAYYEPCVVAYPADGNAFITESGWEGNLVVNDKGLVCTGSSGQSAGEGDNAVGLPVMKDVWLIAAACDNAQDAADMYLNNKMTAIYAENFSVHDVNGGHIVVEASAAHNATRESGDFGEKDYLITTNDFMTEEMQSSLLPAGSGYDDCRPRYYTEEKVITDANGEADLYTMAASIGCTDWYEDGEWHTDNWSLDTGLNSPENLSPFYQNVCKGIAVAETGTMYVMAGCSNTNVSLLPDAAGCYIQLTIGGSASESCDAARTTSNMLIYFAGAYIDSYTGDTTELTEALDTAKAAQTIGDNYAIKAALSSDEVEAQNYYGQAASMYLKAQTYAQIAQNDLTAVLGY